MMLFQLLTVAFVILGLPGSSALHRQESFNLYHGMFLTNHVQQTVPSMSLVKCAAECISSSICLSFNYDKNNHSCSINDNNIDVANVQNGNGIIYGSALPGCGEPPDVDGADKEYSGDYLSALTIYTCKEDHVACHHDNTSVCGSSWQNVTDLCGQFKWINPDAGKYYIPCGETDTFNVTMVGTVISTVNPVSISVRKGGDRLLQIFFNLVTNETKLKHKLDGIWSSNTIVPNLPIVLGTEFRLDIWFVDGEFTVRVNDQMLAHYSSPDPVRLPEFVRFGLQLVITLVQFQV